MRPAHPERGPDAGQEPDDALCAGGRRDLCFRRQRLRQPKTEDISLCPCTTEEEISYTLERTAFHWEALRKYTRRYAAEDIPRRERTDGRNGT